MNPSTPDRTLAAKEQLQLAASGELYQALSPFVDLAVQDGAPTELPFTPASVQHDLNTLATTFSPDKSMMSPHLDTTLNAAFRLVHRPPHFIYGVEWQMKDLKDIVEPLRQEEIAVPTYEAFLRAIDTLQKSQAPDAITKIQELAALFGRAMEQFDRVAPLSRSETTGDDIGKALKTYTTYKLGSSHSPVARPLAEQLHPTLPSNATAHRIEATLLSTPPPELHNDATQIVTSVPIAVEGEGTSNLTYRVTLVIQEANGSWRPVSMNPPLEPGEYDASRHIPSQRFGIWTHDLPQARSRFAVVIESTPFAITNQKEVLHTGKAELTFANEDDVSGFLGAVDSLPDVNVSAFTAVSDKTDTTHVALSSRDAGIILEQLEEAHRDDILDMPLNSVRTAETDTKAIKLSFVLRVGSLDDPGQLVPVSVMINAEKTSAGELMQSPDDLEPFLTEEGEPDDPNDADTKAILKSLLPADLSGVDFASRRLVVYDAVETLQAQRGGGPATKTKRDLITQPLARDEVLAEGEGWAGNLITVVPIVTFKAERITAEPATTVQTVKDVLVSCVETGGDTIVWDVAELRRRADAANAKDIQFLGALYDADSFDDLFLDRDRGATRDSFTFGGNSFGKGLLGSFKGAGITLGDERAARPTNVGSVAVIAQLTPINIRLVLPVEETE